MNISAANGLDKTTANLAEVLTGAGLAELAEQLNAHVETLHNGRGHGAARRPQREIDAELAVAASVSPGQVRIARRLARSGCEGLIVASLLGLLPLATALRGASPPRPNARYRRWRNIVEMCR